MRSSFAPRSIVAIAALFVIGTGCGSSFGGCGTLKPLPAGLPPFGIPSTQVIEGGVQARLTQPGLQKFSKVIEDLIDQQLNKQLACLIKENKFFNDVGSILGWIVMCPTAQPACSGAHACGASVAFNSKDRPAPYNFDDGKNKATFAVADGSNPIVNVTLSFDLDANLNVSWGLPAYVDSGVCNLEVYSKHYRGDVNQPNINLTAPIQLGIDPTTGKLKLTTLPIQISDLGLYLETSHCGVLGTIVSTIFNTIFTALNTDIGNTLLNFATTVLQPQIDSIVQSFLPNPLGLAATIDTGSLLAAYDAPKEAGLEAYLVPGGYVAAKDRGLTLGVLAGANSDRDPTTRTLATASQAALCVPSRPLPALGGAPWNLPAQTVRNTFTLAAAGPFAGMPDAVDPMGNPRDVLIGVSRTYLDLIGFHLYNSGSLCLHIDGTSIPMLNTGTLSLLVPSLGAIALQPKAPLQLVLRPQKPANFTIGAGTASDPLLHMAVSDLRIDVYAWIEERWVRFVTIGLDLKLTLNLTVTKDAMMNPVIQPTLAGLDAGGVTVQVTNSELLNELPSALESALPSLIGIAAGSMTGSLPAVPVPSLPGVSLDDMAIARVTSGMDDFIGIFATVKVAASPAPLYDWTDPAHPRLAGEVRTVASLAAVRVPPVEQLRALFDPTSTATPARPEVQLALSALEANGRPIEWAWKIDGGLYHDWTSNDHPVIDDDAFLLQGHHTITVRSRAVGDYRSEDSVPVVLDVLIDSVAPTLSPHLDDKDAQRLAFGGWDLVTDADHLEYSYLDEQGQARPFSRDDGLALTDVGRITHSGRDRLVVSVRDEAGLVGTYPVDVTPYGHGSWGRVPVSASGCGCELGGAPSSAASGWLAIVGLALLLGRRRLKTLAALAAVLASGTLLVGCGCENNQQQCRIDDECVLLQCDAGKLPVCQENMCVCNRDLTVGEVGRYASMTLIDTTAYVAAYNTTYGDLMIGSLQPPGRVANWSFVDGVPDESPSMIGSHVRGGVTTPGDDVGKWTSIARTHHGEPVIAYYDATNAALKFASFGAIRWRAHTVDRGQFNPEGLGDDVGQWASMAIDSMGRPAIAYSALIHTSTASGKDKGQLRFAYAKVPDPQSPTDWTITIVDKRPLPAKAAGDTTVDLLPNSIAIMPCLAFKLDDTPAIAYHDRERGNLRYAELSGDKWVTSILDGEAMDGTDTADVGQYPSMTFDTDDVAHIAYVDASHDNLLYVDTKDKTPVVVDDGYRPMDEMTDDGLDSPVFHLVGDSSSIQIAQNYLIIAYQDSTTSELRMAYRDAGGPWMTQKIAGHDAPYHGSYGFWASAQVGGRGAYIGSYGIDQSKTPSQFFFEIFFVDLGLVQ